MVQELSSPSRPGILRHRKGLRLQRAVTTEQEKEETRIEPGTENRKYVTGPGENIS